MADTATGYFDNQGAQGTKVTWKNPTVTPVAKRSNGGWYYNPNSGSVDRWWSGTPSNQSSAPAPTTSAPSLSNITTPNTTDQIQPYLDTFQSVLLDAKKTLESPVKSDNQIVSDIKSFVTPSTPAPVVPNLVQTFNNLRADSNVQSLETQLTDLKSQQEEINAQFNTNKNAEKGKPVAMNVIAGRISEEQQQAQDQLDFVGRQISRVTDQLTSQYKLIDTIMNLTSQDFQNASTAYNAEFTKNMQIYSAFRTEKTDNQNARDKAINTVTDVTGKLMDVQLKLDSQAQDAARSNIQIYANLLKSGNVSYNSLPADTKVAINKLEVQSGLGLGFLSTIKQDNPNGDIKSITTRDSNDGQKYADVIIQMPDGSLKVQSTKLGAVTSTNQTAITQTMISKATQILDKVKNSYGNVSPTDWQTARSAWMSDGGTADNFNKNFAQYTDPNRGDFANAYGFDIKNRGASQVQVYNQN